MGRLEPRDRATSRSIAKRSSRNRVSAAHPRATHIAARANIGVEAALAIGCVRVTAGTRARLAATGGATLVGRRAGDGVSARAHPIHARVSARARIAIIAGRAIWARLAGVRRQRVRLGSESLDARRGLVTPTAEGGQQQAEPARRRAHAEWMDDGCSCLMCHWFRALTAKGVHCPLRRAMDALMRATATISAISCCSDAVGARERSRAFANDDHSTIAPRRGVIGTFSCRLSVAAPGRTTEADNLRQRLEGAGRAMAKAT